jgi:hypothetical protein
MDPDTRLKKLFGLLFEIDKRENPELYEPNHEGEDSG